MQLKKIVKKLDKVKENDSILYCFPYAGGGASAFRNWESKLGADIKVCPIQLPGREERIAEKPYLDMETLADDLTNAILQNDNDFMIFGHSMGTKIAYEVEKRLESRGKIAKLLIISGGRVPHIPEPYPIYNLPDKEFEEGLIRFDGMPKEIIENRQLFEFFLPVIRADFMLDESYNSKKIRMLQSPILALWGRQDKAGTFDEIIKWKEYTKSEFGECSFKGQHFFIKNEEEDVLDVIKKRIENIQSRNYDKKF